MNKFVAAASAYLPKSTLVSEMAASSGKVQLISRQFGISPERVVELAELDPTENAAYLTWIVKQVVSFERDPQTGFDPETEGEDVKETLEIYHDVKKRGTFTGHKDINLYTRWGEIARDVEQVLNQTSKKIKGEIPGAQLLKRDGDLKLILVTQFPAAAILFSGTNWCVRHRGTFKTYQPPFLLVTKDDRPWILGHEGPHGYGQVMDPYNIPYKGEPVKIYEDVILKQGLWRQAIVYNENVYTLSGRPPWAAFEAAKEANPLLRLILGQQVTRELRMSIFGNPAQMIALLDHYMPAVLKDIRQKHRHAVEERLPLDPSAFRALKYADPSSTANVQLEDPFTPEDIALILHDLLHREPNLRACVTLCKYADMFYFLGMSQEDIQHLYAFVQQKMDNNIDDAIQIYGAVTTTTNIILNGPVTAHLRQLFRDMARNAEAPNSKYSPADRLKIAINLSYKPLKGSVATGLLKQVPLDDAVQYVHFVMQWSEDKTRKSVGRDEAVAELMPDLTEIPGISKAFTDNPKFAYQYAAYYLKGPFPEGEPAMKRNPVLYRQYLSVVVAPAQQGFGVSAGRPSTPSFNQMRTSVVGGEPPAPDAPVRRAPQLTNPLSTPRRNAPEPPRPNRPPQIRDPFGPSQGPQPPAPRPNRPAPPSQFGDGGGPRRPPPRPQNPFG